MVILADGRMCISSHRVARPLIGSVSVCVRCSRCKSGGSVAVCHRVANNVKISRTKASDFKRRGDFNFRNERTNKFYFSFLFSIHPILAYLVEFAIAKKVQSWGTRQDDIRFRRFTIPKKNLYKKN